MDEFTAGQAQRMSDAWRRTARPAVGLTTTAAGARSDARAHVDLKCGLRSHHLESCPSTPPTSPPRPPHRPGDPPRLLAPEYRALVVGVVGVVVAVAFEAIAVATAMPVAARELGGLRDYGLAFSVFLTDQPARHGRRRRRVRPPRPGPAVRRRGRDVRPRAAWSPAAPPSMLVLVVARAVQGFGAGPQHRLAVRRGGRVPSRPRCGRGSSRPSRAAGSCRRWSGRRSPALLADHVSWRWVFLGVLPLLARGRRCWSVRTCAASTARPTARRARAAAPPAGCRGRARRRRSRAAASTPASSSPSTRRRPAACSSSPVGAARRRRAAAAAARHLPARPRAADGRGPARAHGRVPSSAPRRSSR